MNAAAVFDAPLSYRGRQYPRLKMKQYALLEEHVLDHKRKLAAAICNRANLDKMETHAALAREEAAGISPVDVDTYIRSAAGWRVALRLSLTGSTAPDPEVDAHLDELSPMVAQSLAVAVVFCTDWTDPDLAREEELEAKKLLAAARRRELERLRAEAAGDGTGNTSSSGAGSDATPPT